MIDKNLAFSIVEADEIWNRPFTKDGYEYKTDGMHTYPHQPLYIEYVGENRWEKIIISTGWCGEYEDVHTFFLIDLFPEHFSNLLKDLKFNPFKEHYFRNKA